MKRIRYVLPPTDCSVMKRIQVAFSSMMVLFLAAPARAQPASAPSLGGQLLELRQERDAISNTEADVARVLGGVLAAGGAASAAVILLMLPMRDRLSEAGEEIECAIHGEFVPGSECMDPPEPDLTGRHWALGISVGVMVVGLVVGIIGALTRSSALARRGVLDLRIDRLQHRAWRLSFAF